MAPAAVCIVRKVSEEAKVLTLQGGINYGDILTIKLSLSSATSSLIAIVSPEPGFESNNDLWTTVIYPVKLPLTGQCNK